MTEDLREAAQSEQRDAPASRFDLGSPRLLVAHVLGEPTDRCLAFRAMRMATPEDVRQLMPHLFGEEPT